MAQALPTLPNSDAPSAPIAVEFAHFPSTLSTLQKLQWAYQCVATIENEDVFLGFFDQLNQLDATCFESFGGKILTAVHSDQTLDSVTNFDDKYLTLIQLMAHSDLTMAIQFHKRTEALWVQFANSFVRYTRLQVSLENTQTALLNQRDAGASLHRTAPIMEGGIPEQGLDADELDKALKRLSDTEAVQWRIPLPHTYTRSYQQLSNADDSFVANTKWIDPSDDLAVENFTVLSVPNTRVCRAPTGITWSHGDTFRFRYANSDMYHYFRMSGFTAFSKVTRHVQLAYFLPRVGSQNYYHSLVDKLPALLGYQLLGLGCHIVSSYELDDAEKNFCKQLGIDPESIIVDSHGELIADRGIIPDVEGLRVPFFNQCRAMNVADTLVGKKIYISRAHSPQRPLVNELDVHNLMLSYGYEIVFMENYSLQEQISIARNASTIVSPHGAGLSNMIFAQAGSAVIELIPEKYMTPLFKQLAIDCNHRYSCLMGDVETDSDAIASNLAWRINLSKLEFLLTSLDDQ